MKLSVAAPILASLLFTGCASQPVNDAAGLDVVASITIATDATFAPFHYFDDGGNVTGFDVELAKALARRAGYEPSVIPIAYENLFDDLLAGAYEVVAATTGITTERQQIYSFSDPYFDTCQAALVRTGADEPKSLSELAGRRVGAAGAGTSVRALDDIPGIVPVLLSEREATETTIMDDGSVPVLESGDIDALVVDEFDAVEAARLSSGRLMVLSQPVALEQYGFVFSPANAHIKRQFDRALADMREDGSLLRLQREFGLDRDEDWPVELSGY